MCMGIVDNINNFDAIIIGEGDAALSAALSAHECGAEVLLMKASSKVEHGSHSLWDAVGRTAETPNRIMVKYDCAAHSLIACGGAVFGVETKQRESIIKFYGNVVLALDGFSPSSTMRRQCLDESWDRVVSQRKEVATDVQGRVLNNEGRPVPGLWAVGDVAQRMLCGSFSSSAEVAKGQTYTASLGEQLQRRGLAA